MNDLSILQQLVNKFAIGKKLTQGDQAKFAELKKKYSINDDGNAPTVAALARIMGKSERTIYKWKKQGMPVELDGSYDVDRILAWRGDRPGVKKDPQKSDQETAGDTPDEISEKTLWDIRFRKFRAKLHELEYLHRKGEYFSKEQLIPAWVGRVNIVRSGLLNFSDRLSPMLVGKSQADIFQILRSEVNRLLADFARSSRLTPSSPEVNSLLKDLDRRYPGNTYLTKKEKIKNGKQKLKN